MKAEKFLEDVAEQEMQTDIELLNDGDRLTLYPNKLNPIHRKPVMATYSDGYFYCDGSDLTLGPDYYWRDVLLYNYGFVLERDGEAQ